jgi:hypothetical protein
LGRGQFRSAHLAIGETLTQISYTFAELGQFSISVGKDIRKDPPTAGTGK